MKFSEIDHTQAYARVVTSSSAGRSADVYLGLVLEEYENVLNEETVKLYRVLELKENPPSYESRDAKEEVYSEDYEGLFLPADAAQVRSLLQAAADKAETETRDAERRLEKAASQHVRILTAMERVDERLLTIARAG